MKPRSLWLAMLLPLMALWAARSAAGAEVLTFSPDNFAQRAVAGKEADGIFGDYLLANDRIVAVVANPDLISGRSANRWARPNVAGALLDLTRRDQPNDQLTAYYPGPQRFRPDALQKQADHPDEALTALLPERAPQRGQRVVLELSAYEQASGKSLPDLAALPASQRQPPNVSVTVRYTLEDGWDYLLVELIYHNPTAKAVNLNLRAMLQANDTFDALGLALGDQLYYSYDPWFGQAYGVLAQDHRLVLQPAQSYRCNVLDYLGPDGPTVSLAPGGEFRLVRRLIPGSNLFEVLAVAQRLSNTELKPLTVQVTDSRGPVAGALITASQGERFYACGKTDDKGALTCALPPGNWRLRGQALGAPSRDLTIDLAKQNVCEIQLDAPAIAAVTVRDDKGQALACKLQFRGVAGTADPKTGSTQVGNLCYSRSGSVRQQLPAGQYEVIATYGPEYDAARASFTIAAGEEKAIALQLAHRVQTPGWISADLHNHTTLSGTTGLFYIMEYRWNDAVDGDSTASPLGRVLNLLCEQVEFAVPTDHNFTFDYSPLIQQLDAGKLMASCPGVGLTAGRRHSINHQNMFPVPHRPGAQDGGTLQRPEHVNQLVWAAGVDNSAQKLIQIDQPAGDPVRVSREMGALEFDDLQPILAAATQAPESALILEWLELLRQGYRLTGVINSAAFDNFHGSGGVRNYIKSATDEPEKIKPLDVVRAVKAGQVIMTTGPFLEVSATPAQASAAAIPAGPGDTMRLPDGKANLRVRVQCPNWIELDQVQVLIGGRPDPKLTFTRAGHPQFFAKDAVQFEQTIPAQLAEDSFVIVVASGKGPNLRQIDKKHPETVTHLAVANPIYIDANEEGYQPHSPLDDKVDTEVAFIKPMLAALHAPPGRVQVHLFNRSDEPARDVLRLQIDPEDSARIIGPAEQAYDVPPGGEAYLYFDVAFTDAYLAKKFPVYAWTYVSSDLSVRVARSSAGPGRRAGRVPMSVDHELEQLAPLTDLDQVAAALAKQTVFPINVRRGPRLAQMQLALIGDHLALRAQVVESKIQQAPLLLAGSCVELFAATLQERTIAQFAFLPAVGDKPAAAFQQIKGNFVPQPQIQVRSTAIADGYELIALAPLKILPVRVDSGRLELECRVWSNPKAGSPHLWGCIFPNGAPQVDSRPFGHFRVLSPVSSRLEMLEPLSLATDQGKLRLTVRNDGKEPAHDVAQVAALPAHAAQVVGQGQWEYELAPGQERSFEFAIKLAATTKPLGAIEWVVKRSPRCELLYHDGFFTPVQDRALLRLPAALPLEQVAVALAGEAPLVVYAGEAPCGQLRLARGGDSLLLDMDVRDEKLSRNQTVWKGSCVEVFAAKPGGKKIGHVALTPPADGQPAQAFNLVEATFVPTTEIQLQAAPSADGYHLTAIVPLKMLELDPASDQLTLEVQIGATAGKGMRYSTLFGSILAYQNASRYGWFTARP